MNINLYCVRCKNNGRFLCERCSDPYCSKACQVADWPFHRKICFPMPSLVEIPIERNMISMYDTRNNESQLALTYHTNYQNQNRFGSKNYNGRKNDNFQRTFRDQSFNRPVRHEQYYSGDYRSIESDKIPNFDAKKHDPVLETKKCSPPKLESFPMRKEGERPKDVDKIINLAAIEQSESESLLTKTKELLPKKSINWDEDKSDHINELKQLMTNDLKNWQRPFPLENDTSVTVVYFVESPANSFWVVQDKYAVKRKYLLNEIKRLYINNGDAEIQKIIANEVYCVQYEDTYYRGECVYQINSKEALIRLIDVGIVFQTQISAIKNLDSRLKAINAFAIEVNFENSLNIDLGQTLRIHRFSIDATGLIFVELNQDEIQPTNQDLNIETIPLPVDVAMELFCLDSSNIEKGYISACINDPVKIESINQLSDKINSYVTTSDKTGKYYPKLGEICFAYHDSEHQWYRAECIDEIGTENENFEVIFVDYGSTRILNCSNLRKFAPEFAQPAIMHLCCIKGIPSKPSNRLIKKIITFFNENPFFTITSATCDDGIMIIDCPGLMNAIR